MIIACLHHHTPTHCQLQLQTSNEAPKKGIETCKQRREHLETLPLQSSLQEAASNSHGNLNNHIIYSKHVFHSYHVINSEEDNVIILAQVNLKHKDNTEYLVTHRLLSHT